MSFLCPAPEKSEIIFYSITLESSLLLFCFLSKAIIPFSRCSQLLSQQTSDHKSTTNYFSLSRHTNYPLISQTMNGNVLGFHVGFWVTLAHCIKLKMWVFNQSISYFSHIYENKGLHAPICCCVNYRTIKTCLNYPSKLRGPSLHVCSTKELQIWRKLWRKLTVKCTQRKIILKLFPLLQHDTSDLFMQAIPIQAPLLYSNWETEISSFFYYLIKQNTCSVTWELEL